MRAMRLRTNHKSLMKPIQDDRTQLVYSLRYDDSDGLAGWLPGSAGVAQTVADEFADVADGLA